MITFKLPKIKKKTPPYIGEAPVLELTEDAVADAFAAELSDENRYDHDCSKWFYWGGNRWVLDNTQKVPNKIRHHIRKVRGKELRLSSAAACHAVERLARADQRLAVTSTVWDQDPFLLGTPGGTVDLTTGKLRKALPGDYITMLTSVSPADDGTAHPVFDQFMQDVTQGNADLAAFLLRLGGYCLTGDTREQKLAFLYGPGGNGKSMFTGILSEIMSDYGKVAAMTTFMAAKQQRHLSELAMLRVARLVTASETEKGHGWDESRINQMTGSDPITANFMRQDHFTYIPQFKLIIVGNYKPQLQTVNAAARRRFLIVPFLHKPSEPDVHLREKLRLEYPAILRTLIKGCLDWQKDGLMIPEVVQAATSDYFEDQDLMSQWIAERCMLGDGLKFNASELFQSWKEFCGLGGEFPGTIKTFGSHLAQMGFEKMKSGKVFYKGIGLNLPGKGMTDEDLNSQL